MTTPKDALMHAKVALENEKVTFFERETLDMIKASIPVAELHQQAVDLIQDTHIEDKRWWKKRSDILAKLEAPK